MLCNKLFPLLIALLVGLEVVSQFCKDPQKAIFVSLNSMSKRDTIPNLFMDVDTKLPKYNKTASKQSTNYSIINLYPQLYYSEHEQVQKILNSTSISVQLGKLHLGYEFNYEIITNNTKKNGHAGGHVEIFGQSFIKQLMITKSTLLWQLVSALDLQINGNLIIENSSPKLTSQDQSQFEYMMNQQDMKNVMMQTCNYYYKTLLKQHLHNDSLSNTSTIDYKYNNETYTYINIIKNYTFINTTNIKGLQIYFYFELQNKSTNCTNDNIQIKYKNYGGFQQIYSISSFRQTLIYAANNGYFDIIIDNTWDVPFFQFYMGDLTQIPQSVNYPADQPIILDCKWNRNILPKFRSFYDNFFYSQLNQYCILKTKGNELLQMNIQISMVIQLIPLDDNIVFQMYQITFYLIDFKSIDQKFIITDKNLVKFHGLSVLNGLLKRKVIGTGWKIQKRRFPSLDILNEDYIIIFDPSQI